MGIGINKLTDLTIKSLKPGKYFDGSGLFLRVTPHSKLWRFKYRFARKEKLLALGKYPMVSLKEARNLRDDAIHGHSSWDIRSFSHAFGVARCSSWRCCCQNQCVKDR
jgi:hypothetical protein